MIRPLSSARYPSIPALMVEHGNPHEFNSIGRLPMSATGQLRTSAKCRALRLLRRARLAQTLEEVVEVREIPEWLGRRVFEQRVVRA
jgi:hypothetical protein